MRGKSSMEDGALENSDQFSSFLNIDARLETSDEASAGGGRRPKR